MEKLGLDLDSGGSTENSQQNPQEARRLSIQRCIQSLVHACICRDANCRTASCQKMKRVMLHTKSCKKKQTNGCPVCKQLIALCCYHAKHCQEAKCLVPFCMSIRQKLQQQVMQQRMQQAMLMRRRMAAMQQTNSMPVAGPSMSQVALPGQVRNMLNPMPSTFARVNEQQPLNTNGPDKPSLSAIMAARQAQAAQLAAQRQAVDSKNALIGRNSMNSLNPGMSGISKPVDTGIADASLQRFQSPLQLQPNQQQVWSANANQIATDDAGNNPLASPNNDRTVQHKSVQELQELIRSPVTSQQQQSIMSIFRSNPALISAFLKSVSCF